tara:strand:+ start:897 stop:1154 length:258 start_codon:yes stop_codon:yes gene_type:complete
MNDELPDSGSHNDAPGRALTPDERVRLREFLKIIDTPEKLKVLDEIVGSYTHSRWALVAMMKLAKYVAAITAGIVAYKQLPGLLK